jgi:hypothetical protein
MVSISLRIDHGVGEAGLITEQLPAFTADLRTVLIALRKHA